MDWKDVGNWLKKNAGPGATLVGSLLTGNVPAAVAAGAAMVSSATGESDPTKVLQALQQDPATVVKLRELAVQEGESIRQYQQKSLEAELSDKQAEHKEQQETIRLGDTSPDEYVRHTRPMIARQSWYMTGLYVIGLEVLRAFDVTKEGPQLEMAMILLSPAAAYLGFRTLDKFSGALRSRSSTPGRISK